MWEGVEQPPWSALARRRPLPVITSRTTADISKCLWGGVSTAPCGRTLANRQPADMTLAASRWLTTQSSEERGRLVFSGTRSSSAQKTSQRCSCGIGSSDPSPWPCPQTHRVCVRGSAMRGKGPSRRPCVGQEVGVRPAGSPMGPWCGLCTAFLAVRTWLCGRGLPCILPPTWRRSLASAACVPVAAP